MNEWQRWEWERLNWRQKLRSHWEKKVIRRTLERGTWIDESISENIQAVGFWIWRGVKTHARGVLMGTFSLVVIIPLLVLIFWAEAQFFDFLREIFKHLL